ncbi:hypothetical protein NQ117_05490 [Paenibacillus sp. SC116]|nr:hypothetical protein [Paenibacillus sp. SC116]
MYRLLETASILAVAAAGGFLIAQGHVITATIAFGAAVVIAVPKMDAKEVSDG